MECKNCKYHKELHFGMCDITHMCNTKSCTLQSDEDVEKLHICYNCQHWVGGGDWGLSCAKDYYNCNTNGFTPSCKEFERKNHPLKT